jgi:3-dehydroquinate synthase
MPKVEVLLGDRSYVVHVENGAAARVAGFLPAGLKVSRALVISDENVAPLYADAVVASLKGAGIPAALVAIPAGEREKNLQRVETLYHKMLAAGLDRRSLVVALGGGVVGDIAGFAAATYMRGIPIVQVATTIVAQVDSSVGGKTGVDLPEGKNLVGAFYQPVAVVIDPKTLATLPEREIRAGLAEVIKHGVIRDADYFALLEREGRNLLRMNADLAARIILRSVEIKAAVVSADERESGLRAILNFGHTVGHALEALTGYQKYLHGEAVAVGMIAAANIAVSASLCPSSVAERIWKLVAAVGLPTGPEKVRTGEILAAVARDKKAVAGKARFVLPREIGRVDVVDDIPFEAVRMGLALTGFAE